MPLVFAELPKWSKKAARSRCMISTAPYAQLRVRGMRRWCGGIRVEADRALNILNDMLWTCLVIAAPILVVTLVVGLVISVFQVATQIQEVTLSYVPKILVTAIMMIALGPWMIARITDWTRALYLTIPTVAN